MRKWPVIPALMLALSCARGPAPPSEGDLRPTGKERDVRWSLLPLQQKTFWQRRPEADPKAALQNAMEEEYAWACAARRAGVDRDPASRARLVEAAHRVLFEEFVRGRAVRQLLTEAEVLDYYQKNQIQFLVPEEVEAAHLLVTPRKEAEIKNSTGDDAVGGAAAREKIERLGRELEKGADFSRLAVEWSEDRTAPEGGRIGWFGRGTMMKSFEEAAFSTPPGVTSGVIETEYGFHLVKVLTRRGGTVLPLAEVRREVEDRLLAGRREAVESLKKELFEEVKRDCMAD